MTIERTDDLIAFLDASLEATPVASFVTDTDRRVVSINSEARQLLGLASDQSRLPFCSHILGFPDTPGAPCGENCPLVSPHLGLADSEFALATPITGASHPLVLSVRPIRDSRERVVGLMHKVTRDSARDDQSADGCPVCDDLVEAMKESMRESEEGMALVDEQGFVIFANPAIQQILGTDVDFTHRPLCRGVMVGRVDDGSSRCEALCPMLTSGSEPRRGPLSQEMTIETSDGRERVISTVCWKFRSRGATADRGFVTVRDITRLTESRRSRSDFVSMVAHELRTPLTSIKGCAGTLLNHRRTMGEERTEAFLTIINEQCDRLRDLVDNVLDLSRIEGGTLRIRREPVRLCDVVDRLVQEIKTRARDRRLVAICSSDLPVVWADPRRIEQVLSNLVDNALKYSPSSEPVALEVSQQDGSVLVEVRDRGLGIPPEQVERIFDKFYRVDAPATRHVRGSGLGLSICRGLIDAHGGNIWVESTLGHGSAFRFTLPVRNSQSGETATSQGADGLTSQAILEGQRTTAVLIGEGEDRLARFLRAGLEAAEYRPTVTSSVKDVFDELDAQEYGVILLGARLLDGHGLDICRQLRASYSIPIIIVDREGQIDRDIAIAYGASDYLAWPFGTAELSDKVQDVLQRGPRSPSV